MRWQEDEGPLQATKWVGGEEGMRGREARERPNAERVGPLPHCTRPRAGTKAPVPKGRVRHAPTLSIARPRANSNSEREGKGEKEEWMTGEGRDGSKTATATTPSRGALSAPPLQAQGGRLVVLAPCRANQERLVLGGGRVRRESRRLPRNARVARRRAVRLQHSLRGQRRHQRGGADAPPHREG